MTSLKLIAVAALAIGALAGTAIAENQSQNQNQTAPSASPGFPRGIMGPGMMGAMTNPGMMMNAGMMGQGAWAETMCNAMAGHVDGRLGYIKAELKIADAQESLWNAYAATARDNANIMLTRCTTMMGRRDTQVSLTDRLDQNEQLLAAQLDAVRAMNKALKPLYGALSDSQKQAADQLFLSPMGMM